MSTTELPSATTGPAVAGPVERPVRPCAWAHRYSPRGLLHTLRDNQQDAENDAAIVGGSAHVVALYDQAALDAAAAAERERCANIARRRAVIVAQLGRTDAEHTAASILEDIEEPNARLADS